MAEYQEDPSILQFEREIAEKPDGHFRLKLYVTGSTPRSTKAIENLRAICERHLTGRYELEVVDLYQQPELASEAQVIAAPTAVREEPTPRRRVIGDMSNEDRVLGWLEIEEE